MFKNQQIAHIQHTLCNPNDKFWELFDALGDCVRYRMIKVMMHHRNMNVSDLAAICEITPPAASQQLKKLEQAGIVRAERDGQSVYYSLHPENAYLKKVVKLIDEWLDTQQSNQPLN